MSKKFSLPKKKSATEAAATAGQAGIAAFPVDTTDFRKDFTEQAKQLKEKIILGPAPKRVEKPKNDLTLNKDGKLKGEIDVLEEPKKSEAVSVDLTENAKAVNEGVKRPVFKRRSASTEAVSTSTEATQSNDINENKVCTFSDLVTCDKEVKNCSDCPDNPTKQQESAPVKDERESTDKEPKEAVACEETKNVATELEKVKQTVDKMASSKCPWKGATLLMELPVDEISGWDDPLFQAVMAELKKDPKYFVTAHITDDVKDCYVSTKDDFAVYARIVAQDTESPVEKINDDVASSNLGGKEIDSKFYDELAEMQMNLSEGYSAPASMPAGDTLSSLIRECGREELKELYLNAFKEDKSYYVRKLSFGRVEDYYISVRDDAKLYVDMSDGGSVLVGAREEVEVVKDERESEDKQPKEAVACESRFPVFNAREKDFIRAKDASGVRAAMASGAMSRVRGRQLLYMMGEKEATEDVEFPQATDMGKPVEQPDVADAAPDDKTQAKIDCEKGRACSEAMEGFIDTEIGDNMGHQVTYTSKTPLAGQVNKLTKDAARLVAEALESHGISTRTLSAKEEYSVLFTTAEQVPTAKWYALVTDKNDSQKVLQLTLTTSSNATPTEVEDYLRRIYGADGVLQVSPTKIV